MVCLRSDDENAKEETFMYKRIVILLLCLLTAFGTASSLAVSYTHLTLPTNSLV